jgi:ribosome maturation factor RimP
VDSSKTFTGILTGYEDGNVSLRAGQKDYTFEKAQVAKVRLRIV